MLTLLTRWCIHESAILVGIGSSNILVPGRCQAFAILQTLCIGLVCWTDSWLPWRPIKKLLLPLYFFCSNRRLELRISSHSKLDKPRNVWQAHAASIQQFGDSSCQHWACVAYHWRSSKLLQVFTIQWNLSVTTTSIVKSVTCDLLSNVF